MFILSSDSTYEKYDNLSCVSQNVLKFYQQLTGEERRIPFIFDDFHFCRSRVIGLDMTENRIFTLCRMITWVVFLRMFWNFISSLTVKRGGSLSFLVGTIGNVLVMFISKEKKDATNHRFLWTGPYVAHLFFFFFIYKHRLFFEINLYLTRILHGSRQGWYLFNCQTNQMTEYTYADWSKINE